jgi:hypothetical protein
MCLPAGEAPVATEFPAILVFSGRAGFGALRVGTDIARGTVARRGLVALPGDVVAGSAS